MAFLSFVVFGSFVAVAGEGPRIPRRKPLTANVGIVSVGLDTYWKQCPGLLEDMVKKEDVFVRKVAAHQVKVSRFGMSDNPAAAKAMVPAMKAADLDILFVDMVTYATSSTFAPFVRELNVPIVLFALQPDDRLDYEHATIYRQLLNDDLCSVPEFTGVAIRYGRPVADAVIGKLEGDARADEEIRQWCAVSRTFGCHVALCEPDEILPYYREPVAADVDAMKKRILAFFDTPDPVSDPWTEKLSERDLDVAAKAACALEKFIAKRNLDGFAYYYEGEEGSMTRELVTNFIVGNSLLTAAGFPMCGEFDLKNCIAMMIFDRLDIGGSFAEFHPIDFGRDTVLVGHDGPHHLNIAAQKPMLRSLKKYHGKPGKGAGVEFNIKEGPITMMSLGLKADGSFKFVVAEGESLKGPIPPTGNTNTHGRFLPDVRTFLRRWSLAGPTHHFALGVGHHAAELKKLGKALGVEVEVVTPER